MGQSAAGEIPGPVVQSHLASSGSTNRMGILATRLPQGVEPPGALEARSPNLAFGRERCHRNAGAVLITQLAEVHKKIRVASDPGLDPGEEAPKGEVGPRRALPAGRGPEGQHLQDQAWPVVRGKKNGPPRSRSEVGLRSQSNAAGMATTESTAESGLKRTAPRMAEQSPTGRAR